MSTSNADASTQTNIASSVTRSAGFSPDLFLSLDLSHRRGIRGQIERELRLAIQHDRLAPGTQLPPSRALARDLGVSRSVIAAAYAQLVADGYLHSRQGSGTRVRAVADPVLSLPPRDAGNLPAAGFIGGLPDPAHFPRSEWLRHYRTALNSLPDNDFVYPGPHGALALRTALAHYLGRVRGVLTTPADLLITTGFTQALALLSRALRARGATAMAVEDPCFGFHRQVIAAAGLQPVPIPVDQHGIDVELLAEHQVDAVLLAPAHSYPTGAVLSAPRRAQLIAWAAQRGTLVIEDDYDAEFRYDRNPAGALHGLAPNHVVYAGSASKTLSPALRLGWLAAPPHLLADLLREKAQDDLGTGLLEQLALARLIDTGGFTRHLRRMRPIYRQRRDAALRALAEHLPAATATGVDAGLHVYAQLPERCDEHKLIELSRQRGVLLEGAAWHWAEPTSAPTALVIGYATLSEEKIRKGLAVVGSSYSELCD